MINQLFAKELPESMYDGEPYTSVGKSTAENLRNVIPPTHTEKQKLNIPPAIFLDKQLRLLVESLYSSWMGTTGKQRFLAARGLGLRDHTHSSPLYPDFFLRVDMSHDTNELLISPAAWTDSGHLSLQKKSDTMVDVVIDVVSNQYERFDLRMREYGHAGIPYFVIYDPAQRFGGEIVRAYQRQNIFYVELDTPWLPQIELGLMVWHGTYEGVETAWLRWCDRDGKLIASGIERVEYEYIRAEHERQRAERERKRAERERKRAEIERRRAEIERLEKEKRM